jgi:surface protein
MTKRFFLISKLFFVFVSFAALLSSCGQKGNSSPIAVGSNYGGPPSPPSPLFNNEDLSLAINGGAEYTGSSEVTLDLSASGASHMYITNTPGCAADGIGGYETFSASRSWSLSQLNAEATVYVKFRDAAGNESACISDSIIHDDSAPENMIFTIVTTSSDETFTLPFRSGYNYSVEVSWGDGSFDDITSWDQDEATHTFENAGTYTITLSGLAEAWSFNNTGDSKDKIRTVIQLGDLGWTDLAGAFFGCSNLTSFTSGNTDTSSVTNMSSMFSYANSLTSLDLSSFNTSSVTNMSSMFSYANSLTSLDLSSFNTSSVTNMSQMFFMASFLTSLDLSGFNTSSVINMSLMFSGATSLTSLDLTNWNTESGPSYGGWILGIDPEIIYCNDPDGGGTGLPGTGTVNGVECN